MVIAKEEISTAEENKSAFIPKVESFDNMDNLAQQGRFDAGSFVLDAKTELKNSMFSNNGMGSVRRTGTYLKLPSCSTRL